MHPEEISYRLVTTPSETTLAHEFLLSLGEDVPRLGFPTVLAWEGDEIVGLFSTLPRKDMIIAGPLAFKSHEGNQLVRLIRLVEAYESVLRHAGVTQYLFFVPDKHARWKEFIERTLDTEPIQVETDRTWYKRDLTDGRWWQHDGSSSSAIG